MGSIINFIVSVGFLSKGHYNASVSYFYLLSLSFKWANQLLGNVVFHQTDYAVLDILWRFWDEPSAVSLDHVTPISPNASQTRLSTL